MINCIESYSFDDLMLVPKYSTVKSRSAISTSVELCKGFRFKHPIVPSNMKTITELVMAKNIYDHGGLGIFHRFADLSTQLEWLNTIKTWGKDATKYIGFSIGIKKEDYTNVNKFVSSGAEIICIDIAHGDSEHCLEMINYVATYHPQVLLIAGNTATGEGAKRIWKAGADICKANVGSGSICTTRINTGNGVPAMTTLIECAQAKQEIEKYINRKIFLMNDGGCKNSGDLVKALCFADLVMTGSLFAGCAETPGSFIKDDTGAMYKTYEGSSTHKTDHIEGVKATIPIKDSAHVILTHLLQGIKSGCSYQNAHDLTELKKNPRFVKITSAGLHESRPHIFTQYEGIVTS